MGFFSDSSDPNVSVSIPLLQTRTQIFDLNGNDLPFLHRVLSFTGKKKSLMDTGSSDLHRSLAVINGHIGSVSCMALCGEFILSASQGKDIIAWKQPDLHQFAKFGQGEGAVKALEAVGNKVFSAHQDGRIRVWKVTKNSENSFKLVATLPTRKDYLGNCMKQRNYIQTRRNHTRLWIEHVDSISCLAICNDLIYSGSWDKTLKVWRISDNKCLESIKAHDDAINGLVAHKGVIYSASADGKIKVWRRNNSHHYLLGILEGDKDISLNCLIVCEDGSLVYGAGSNGTVKGWKGDDRLDTWKRVCDFRAHEMAVLCLSSIEDIVCSGSADKSIKIWKRENSGNLLTFGVIKGHDGPVKCLQASSPIGDGFLLYSGGLDKSLRVWWVSKGNESEEEKKQIPLNKNVSLLLN